MKKKILRFFAAVVTGIIVFALVICLTPSGLQVLATEDTPVFALSIDKTSAKQGDYVKVTMTVNNDTGMPLTAFTGTISYNSKYYEYLYYILEEDVGQTISCGNGATFVKDNSVTFFYADPSADVIPGNGKTIKVFSIMCRVLSNSPEGAPYFSAVVDQCYGNASGDHTFSIANIAQKNVTIKTTAATKSTTASQKTTTESTTTTTSQTTASTSAVSYSHDARLGSLQVSPGALVPAFSTDNLTYKVEVAHTDSVIRIVAPPNDSNATVEGSGAKPLNLGDNTFTIKVTAEDGATVREYKIIVHRAEQPEPTQPTVVSAADQSETFIISGTDDPEPIVHIVTPSDISEPTENGELEELLNGDDDRSDEEEESFVLKIIGIAFAEIALFFFGFLSGYYIDKNNKKKEMQLNEFGRANPMQRGMNAQYQRGRNQQFVNQQIPTVNEEQYAGAYQQAQSAEQYDQTAYQNGYTEQYQQQYAQEQYTQEQYAQQQYPDAYGNAYSAGYESYGSEAQGDYTTFDDYNDPGFGQ